MHNEPPPGSVFLGALALGKAVIARLAGGGHGAPTSTAMEERQYGQTY